MLMKNSKITFYTTKVHQSRYAEALAAGMKKHGYKNVQIKTSFSPSDCSDLAVFWAHKKGQIINAQKSRGLPYLVMERAYVANRFEWVSLGYNGLNGNANFYTKNITDSDRWNKHFSDYLLPWRTTTKETGKYALLIGQVKTDASVRHVNIHRWYEKVIKELNELNIPVVFRPHPLDKIMFIPESRGLVYTIDTNESLEQSLEHAKFTVTFSSNSGVISVLRGIPTISWDIGSMAYNVTQHNLHSDIYTEPDRKTWCNKLAYCQWLEYELSDGTAWEHLEQGLVNT